MTTRRSFLAMLAALVVAPKVLLEERKTFHWRSGLAIRVVPDSPKLYSNGPAPTIGVRVRVGLPRVQWRELNEGVKPHRVVEER